MGAAACGCPVAPLCTVVLLLFWAVGLHPHQVNLALHPHHHTAPLRTPHSHQPPSDVHAPLPITSLPLPLPLLPPPTPETAECRKAAEYALTPDLFHTCPIMCSYMAGDEPPTAPSMRGSCQDFLGVLGGSSSGGGMADGLNPSTRPLLSGRDVMDLATEHACASILFTDIAGFTAMSRALHPAQVLLFLNHLYSRFDDLLEEHVGFQGF